MLNPGQLTVEERIEKAARESILRFSLAEPLDKVNGIPALIGISVFIDHLVARSEFELDIRSIYGHIGASARVRERLILAHESALEKFKEIAGA